MLCQLYYFTQRNIRTRCQTAASAPIQNQPAVQSVRHSPVKPVSRRWVNAAPIRGEVMPAAVRVKPVGSSPRAHGYGATPRVLSAHPHSKATPPGPAPPVPSPPVPALPGPIPQVPAPPERPPEFLILPKKYFLGGGHIYIYIYSGRAKATEVDPPWLPESPDPPWPPKTPDPPWPAWNSWPAMASWVSWSAMAPGSAWFRPGGLPRCPRHAPASRVNKCSSLIIAVAYNNSVCEFFRVY